MGGRGGPGRAPQPATSFAASSPMGRAIKDAIRDLNAGTKGNPKVLISDVRERLGGTRLQQDSVMRNLARKGEISISTDQSANLLPNKDWVNAVMVKGKLQHFLRLK